MRPDVIAAACSALILSLTTPDVSGQCPLPFAPYTGPSTVPMGGLQYNPNVKCTIPWDPDGAGPLAELLVAGGTLGGINGVRTSSVAAWTGDNWLPFGTIQGDVRALTVWNGQLVAGGVYMLADGNPNTKGVARWDGQSWSPFAQGLRGEILALAVYEETLYAGGRLEFPQGSLWEPNVVRWNGSAWESAPGTLGLSAATTSLLVHQGVLYAGGNFGPDYPWTLNAPCGIARLNPQTGWEPVGIPPWGSSLPEISFLMSDGEDLLAVGRFTRYRAEDTACQIMRWNGATWSDEVTAPTTLIANSVARFNGDLYVGGDQNVLHTLRDGVLAPVGPILEGRPRITGSTTSGVIVGGEVRYASLPWPDNQWLNTLSLWNGENYVRLAASTDGAVNAFVDFGGTLHCVGGFQSVRGQSASRIAKFEGENWVPLPNGQGPDDNVFCAAVWNERLVLGGSFLAAGGVPANHIAVWDGTAWESLGTGIPERAVHRLYNYNGELLAVCSDSLVFGQLTNPTLRRWSGTAWDRFGDSDGSDASVSRLVVHDGEAFESDGNHVRRWDGSDWVPVIAANPNDRIAGVWQDSLLCTSGARIYRVAGTWIYDDSTAGTSSFAQACHDYLEHRGALYLAVGDSLRRWDGSTWRVMLLPRGDCSNIAMSNRYAAALAVINNQVIIGGALPCIRFPTQYTDAPGEGLVWLSHDAVPIVASQPADTTFEVGGTTSFSLDILNPTEVTVQWYLNSLPLTDGLQPTLEVVSGAQTSTLTIANCGPFRYRCQAALVHVEEPLCVQFTRYADAEPPIFGGCDPIDFNRDGIFPDTNDITEFLSVFGGGVCSTGMCGDIDFNNDGLFPDLADIESVIRLMSGGPC